ncbi:hypothetical protein A3730_17215 [Alcanivorax sp. HI0044]|nr:hypothetical protein A3730_17215 [Alcanivorax sp. HI0044]
MGVDDQRHVRKALSRIKKKCGVSEYKKSIKIIRSDGLYRENGIARDFPLVLPRPISELSEFSEREIIFSINENSEKIANLLDFYSEILTHIESGEYAESLAKIRGVVECGGVSFILVRYLYYIRLRVDENPYYSLQLADVNDLFHRINIDNLGFLVGAIRELSNVQADYFNIRRRIADFESDTPVSVVAKNLLDFVVYDESEYLRTLNAYYSISLLDAFLYMSVARRLGVPGVSECGFDDSVLHDAFSRLSDIKINTSIYVAEDNEAGVGISFFRETFLRLEQWDCYNYKMIHGALFNEYEAKAQLMIPGIRTLVEEYFSSLTTLDELSFETKSVISLESYDRNACSYLENSSGLIYLLDKYGGDIEGHENEFVALMSATRDIGVVCPSSYLIALQNEAKSDDFKLVTACLISIKDNTQRAEHRLRKTIQEIAKNGYESDVKGIIYKLFDISPSVTEHLVHVCDETFLSKLFHITSRPNKAIEDRADILEWYGNKMEDSQYLSRARNLRIDVQINKEKGTIDDARIYVDQIKYTQWVSDMVMPELSLLIPDLNSGKEMTPKAIRWSGVRSGISIFDLVASNFLDCFKEFCENKFFGIASYLGRRIRHGTLVGTGLEELKDITSEGRFSNLLSDPEFNNHFLEWIELYEGALTRIVKEYLYVRDDAHPQGLFSSYPNSKYKQAVANQMLLDVHNKYIKSGNFLDTPYVVMDYCWRLIEEDLSGTRKFLSQIKSKYGVFSVPYNVSRKVNRRELNDFVQEVNSISADKFRVISSWFNKPSFASPSTDLNLLFKAVTSEVKGLHAGFDPRIEVGDEEFPINGGQYFAIYDALYVLIYNAAAYGKQAGKLVFNVFKDQEQSKLMLMVMSEVDDEKTLNKAKRVIESKLESDTQDAHVREGNSGIKKLLRLAVDGYIGDVNYVFERPNKIVSSFSYKLDY